MLYYRKPNGRYAEATPDMVCEEAARVGTPERGEALTSTSESKRWVRAICGTPEHELFGVIYLDNRHRVIGHEIMFRGTVDGASVYPREVAKGALYNNAAACIVFHNHPSGEPEPSRADVRITERLKDALNLIDVRVLDHLIVGDTTSSFAQKGLL